LKKASTRLIITPNCAMVVRIEKLGASTGNARCM
jgi:hypothetical protein